MALTKDKENEITHIESSPPKSDKEDPKETAKSEDEEFTPAEQKRIIRRIDWRITVCLGFIYCISLMDRTNLGAASLAGMTKELELEVHNRYNLVALVLFFPYILFVFPAPILARFIGPRLFIGSIVTLWGVVLTCSGVVQNYKQLIALRVLLGALEGGYYPACIYLLNVYYTRYEVHKRFAIFYLIATASSAFAGILAYGFMQMNGLDHKTGWRWIFIMEGLITVVVGLTASFILVDFPEKAARSYKFLTQREGEWVMRRIEDDRGDGKTEAWSSKKFFGAAKDLQLWCYCLVVVCLTSIAYSVAYFFPIILHQQLGFSVAASQCLIAPPYAAGAFVMYGCAHLGDKYKLRGPILITMSLICIIGLVVMTWGGSPGVQYFGIFLVVASANANVPTLNAFQANNIRGQWKRAFSSASLVCGGGLGGIVGSLIFRSQDAPRYLNGIYGCIVACLLTIIIVGGLDTYFYFQNRLARDGKKTLQGYAGFLYTY